MEKIMKNQEETIAFAEEIGSHLTSHSILLLTGDLGAGKTTFTKGIGKALGVTRVINSPTFTIMKLYQGTSMSLCHFDFYRLLGSQGDMDLEEYIDTEDVVVIEWPMCFDKILPEEYLEIQIERISETERKITLLPKGKKYEDLVGELK